MCSPSTSTWTFRLNEVNDLEQWLYNILNNNSLSALSYRLYVQMAISGGLEGEGLSSFTVSCEILLHLKDDFAPQ